MSSLRVLDVALGLLAVYLVTRVLAKKPAPYPPGPKGLPIVGNLLDYPKDKEWETFGRWKQEFGSMTMLNLLGQRVLILNSAKTTNELLDRKSNNYSDRPTTTMVNDLIGLSDGAALIKYGDRWRTYRRLMHSALTGKKNLEELALVMEHDTRQFLLRVVDGSDAGLQSELRRLAGTIILKVAYGYTVTDVNDPLVKLIELSLEDFAKVTTPGTYLVDVIPALKYVPAWFPGAGFHRDAAEIKKRTLESIDRPLAFTKEQMATGKYMPSFTSKHLEEGTTDEEVLRWVSSAIYGGGADTTVSSNYSFFLAMTLHPEIQAKARAEIDAVIGRDRLPTVADREHLPYVDALVKEIYRWNPVGPQGVPHRATDDDVHDGYFIPKGTLCIPNTWGFLHDPQTYADPMTFNPERFLSTPTHPAEQDSRAFAFGFGRRICPGIQLADASVFVLCASSIAALSIDKAKDAQGRVVEPKVEYTSGLISHPRPFECVVRARDRRAEELVRMAEHEA